MMDRFWKLIPLYIVLLGIFFPCTFAQGQTVNIMLFYEREDSMTSFDGAIDYVKNNPSVGVAIGEVYKVMLNDSSDVTMLIQQLCEEIDTSNQNEGKSPDIIVDFTRQGIPSETVKMLAKVMSLPTISATFGQQGDIHSWKDLTDKQKNYLIQIAPPADMLPQAARSLAHLQNMNSAALLFDDEFEMNHKYKSLFKDLPTRSVLSQLGKSLPALRRQIDRLVHVDIINFLIAASPSQISEVLTEASNPEMNDGPYFSDEYAWYSMSMEPGIPSCGGCQSQVSVIHLEPKYPETGKIKAYMMSKGYFQSYRLMDLFYFDLTLNAILTVAKMKKEGSWIPPPKRVCKEQTTISDDYQLNLFDNLMSPEISENNLLGRFHFDPERTAGKSFVKFEMTIRRLLFKPKEPEPFQSVETGTWQAGFGEGGLIFKSQNTEQHWRSHLPLFVLRVVTVVQPPFVYKIPNCDALNIKYTRCYIGYCIDLLDKMAEELKFNYTIRNVTAYGYMRDDPPHAWSGMVREIKDRRADIAVGAMSVLPERMSAIDFTEPIYDDLVGFSILMRKPRVRTSFYKFLVVLENDVWLCIVGAYALTSILMWVFDRTSPYSYQNNKEEYDEVDDQEKRIFNLRECFWFCIASLTPQGGGETPKCLSARLVATTWWLFGFIIVASYTANLAAFLTVSRLDAPIESLDDLTMQHKVQYAPLLYSSAWIYFDRRAHVEHRLYEIWKDMSLNDSMGDYERSQLAVWDYPLGDKYTKMWQAMQENSPPHTFKDAIARVRGRGRYRDPFAFIDDATNVCYQTLISCDFQQIGQEFSPRPYAFAVQKGSPLKQALSHMIRKLGRERYLEKLKATWWDKNPFKATCPSGINTSEGIIIRNIGGVFMIIVVGIVLAALSVLIEFCWCCWRRSRAEKMAEKATLPTPKKLSKRFSEVKSNFNTEEPTKSAEPELPSVDSSW